MKLLIIVGILLAFIAKIAYDIDAFKTPKAINNYKNCTYFDTDIIGPEDMTQFNETTIIVGSGDFQKLWAHGKPIFEQLGVYAILNTDSDNPSVIKLRIKNFPNDISFYVHGIYVRKQADANYLYAINHAYHHGGERIEVFTIDEQLQLTYIHSIIMDEKYNGILNDLIVIEDQRFITTKFMPLTDPKEGRSQYTASELLYSVMVWMTGQKKSYLVDCRFKKESTIIKPDCTELLDANGIILNGITWNKKDRIYVGDTMAEGIHEYKITSSGIEFQRFIPTLGGIDNLEYQEETNSLIIGLIPQHYNYLQLDGYLKSNNLNRETKFDYWGTVGQYNLASNEMSILAQDMNLPKGLAGGIVSGQNLYIGSWCDITVMVCKKSQN